MLRKWSSYSNAGPVAVLKEGADAVWLSQIKHQPTQNVTPLYSTVEEQQSFRKV